MKKIIKFTFLLLFFSSALLFVSQFALHAKDYDYGCRIRKPNEGYDQSLIAKYIQGLDYIFVGKPIKQGRTVMDMRVTTFQIKRIYKGKMPDDKKIKIIHLKEMFTDLDGTYQVRARYGRDRNLYPDPLACPKFYKDEEVVSFIMYYWHRLIIGFFVVMLGVLLSLKLLKYDQVS